METTYPIEYLGRDERGGSKFRFRSDDAPPDDGIMGDISKVWLTVKEGETSWAEFYFPTTLVYVNAVPRIIALAGDRVFVKVARGGRQSLRVTRARRRDSGRRSQKAN